MSYVIIKAKINGEEVQADCFSLEKMVKDQPAYPAEKFEYLGEGTVVSYDGTPFENKRKYHFWKRK